MAASQQQMLMQLLQQSAQQSQRPQVEFKCGKMKKNEGETRVTPDLRKGKLTVRADQDQLMHFIWTNREQGIEEDDMIIFPGDATFGYVEQARNNKTNNRVYALKFASTKKVHFFWMQEPNADKDKELAEKVNAMINGEAPSAAGPGQMDQAQLMAMLTQAHSPSVTEAAQPESESPAAPAAGDSAAPAASDSTGGASGEAGAGGSAEAKADGDSSMKVDEEPKEPK